MSLRSPVARLPVATLLAAAFGALSGCTVYHASPLEPERGSAFAALTVPAGTTLPAGLRTHPFDPSDGLDATEVAMLAIVGSPALRALRAQAEVGRAQAFAAGLLPDPVLGFSRDQPSAGQAGAATAYSGALSWDIGQLATYGARREAGRHTDEQVDLALLWDEWQVIARSRLLFAKIVRHRELVERLEHERAAIAPLRTRLTAALTRGTVTFDVATTGLSAASDVERQYAEARSTLAQAEADLRELLGLAAGEPLRLTGEDDDAPPDAAAVDAAIDAMPPRRPDLRALYAGYQAEESRLRAAVLGQFPSLNVGVTKARDNSDISSRGFTLSISLPVFDRNQGAIRVEQATRAQLRAEYAGRVLAAHAQAAQLLEATRILGEREATLVPYAAALEASATRAADAYGRGLIDWTTYLALRQSALSASTELIALHETLAEAQIGLATIATGDWSACCASPPGAAP